MEDQKSVTKTKWSIDQVNSQIGFSVKYLIFSTVRGYFRKFSVEVEDKGGDLIRSDIKVIIQSDSIDTGIEQRDEHLRNIDFFDTDMFPEIIFTSTGIAPTEQENRYIVSGMLEMVGIKKEVQLTVVSGGMIKDPWGVQKALFSVSGKINRHDWSLNWNSVLEAGGLLVSEEVGIQCDVLLIKQEDVE